MGQYSPEFAVGVQEQATVDAAPDNSTNFAAPVSVFQCRLLAQRGHPGTSAILLLSGQSRHRASPPQQARFMGPAELPDRSAWLKRRSAKKPSPARVAL